MSKKKRSRYWKKEFIETKLKHGVLETYLPAYWRILGKTAPGFIFIDGFAGPGRYQDGSKGSPLLAMELVAGQRSKWSLMIPVYFAFIEADKGAVGQLEKAALPLAKDLGLNEPLIKHGSFQEHIFPILRILEGKCQRMCPTFIFIDPFGYKDVPLNLIAKLASARNRELFITFMSQPMARFLSDEAKSKTYDSVFGSRAWQQCFFEREYNDEKYQECLARVYAEELNKVLKKELETYIFPFHVKAVKRGGLYHLIHVSHHPKARQVIDQAVSAAGATKRDAAKKLIRDVGLGFKIPDAEPVDAAAGAIVSFLQQKRKPVPVLDVAAHLWRTEEFMSLRWRDFEATVILLSHNGIVIIERPENQPKRRKSSKHLYPEKGETLRLANSLTE